MVNENKTWFLDFSEKGQMWHIDLERVPENDSWVNIGYGRYEVLSYFCDMVDVLTTEFKMHLTPEQVLRLAECTPGLTVYQNTDVPEGEFDSDVHMRQSMPVRLLRNILLGKRSRSRNKGRGDKSFPLFHISHRQ